MSSVKKSLDDVKGLILSAHDNVSTEEKVNFYSQWAKTYEQDVDLIEYRAPRHAADSVATHFTGDPGQARVLDVACGTGLVARRLKGHGFRCVTGVDGSASMLEEARATGLYGDLEQCLLGEQTLPVTPGCFDVVVIVGALSVGQVPVAVIRELCKVTKAGGCVCMTTRSNHDNLEYKHALEAEMRRMEEETLWRCEEVKEVQEWERSVQEDGYIPGAVYLYRKL